MGVAKGYVSETHNFESFNTILDEPVHNIKAILSSGGMK
jgi:hypothetical protein